MRWWRKHLTTFQATQHSVMFLRQILRLTTVPCDVPWPMVAISTMCSMNVVVSDIVTYIARYVITKIN